MIIHTSGAHAYNNTRTHSCHVCMCTHVYMLVVVNFNALPQASDFRVERRQVVFISWMQDSKLGGLRHQISSKLNAHSQTDWAFEDQAKTLSNMYGMKLLIHSKTLTAPPGLLFTHISGHKRIQILKVLNMSKRKDNFCIYWFEIYMPLVQLKSKYPVIKFGQQKPFMSTKNDALFGQECCKETTCFGGLIVSSTLMAKSERKEANCNQRRIAINRNGYRPNSYRIHHLRTSC